MCGIAGWISYNRNLEDSRNVIATMTETLANRGPDAEGSWIDGHAGLGHRRLAVIDIAGGVQPMVAKEQGQTLACLVYTGEVYNFVELRAELQTYGHHFDTRSDTEVVLRGYLQWGERVAERLNGMFAFAVWDSRLEELFLVRDRLGVKPLFYYPTSDGVLFGSEPKAILAHPAVRPRVDINGFREMLVWVRNPERTVYSGMSEVRPGQVVRINRAGLTKRSYWTLNALEHTDDQLRTVNTVRDLLHDIIERYVVSDVPLCSLLSGGLDSSTVTALAQRAVAARAGEPLRSFSVDFVSHGEGFRRDDFHKSSDIPFVRDFVAHTGGNHQEIVLDSGALADPDQERAVLRAGDFPSCMAGDMFSSLHRLFQTIRAQSTVALSGEAADELFGGYTWFFDSNAIERAAFPWLTTSSHMFVGDNVLAPHLRAQLNIPQFLNESYRAALDEVPRLGRESPFERRMRELSYLNLTRFLPLLLDRKDRMSMAVGLEVRVPFCDHRLVEYVFNIPWHLKTFDGREKSILRAAARHLLPSSILERQKSPYPATQDPRYEQAVRLEVAALMSDRSHPAASLFDRQVIETLLAQPLQANSSLGTRNGLERVRWIARWVKEYGVEFDL
jgi:asparagine synthase (glutamine-hydrolysing)